MLYRLERAGLVGICWETRDRGGPRKYYRLTPAGRRELDRLASEWRKFATAMHRLLDQEE